MLSEIGTLRYLNHGIAMTASSTEQEKHIKFKRSLPEPVVNNKKVKGGKPDYEKRRVTWHIKFEVLQSRSKRLST